MSIKTEKTIGFLGLGTMGFPMCCGLSKAGFRMILPAYRRSVDQAAGYSPLAKDETEKTALIDEMLKNGAVAAVSQKELLEQGIRPGTIRLSIGTEHIDDILEDLEEAFRSV